MKKVILIICIVVALVLLIPFPSKQKDGGTVHYNAIIYDVYDFHRIKPIDDEICDDSCGTEYIEGTIVKLFGIEIFNNTISEFDSEDNNGNDDSQNPYFVGKVIEINEKGLFVKVTDTGNGSFAPGEMVQVNIDFSSFPKYNTGDNLRITFDGKVAMSYPPQVTSVTQISKVDG